MNDFADRQIRGEIRYVVKLSSYNIFVVLHYDMCHFFRKIFLDILRKHLSLNEGNQGQDNHYTKK